MRTKEAIMYIISSGSTVPGGCDSKSHCLSKSKGQELGDSVLMGYGRKVLSTRSIPLLHKPSGRVQPT
ncbi:MAG: hypothetical protein ACYS6I_06805, partial [Planctomycetota bacterium]